MHGVCKRYGAVQAPGGVDLVVHPGERVALVGHNGAGKTTLIRLALGLAAADTGEISIMGARPGSTQARKCCAYLPEAAAFHPSLTGYEQIRLYARLRQAPVARAVECLERVGLNGAARNRIGTYSRGMRQRLGLAQVLLGTPGFLLLDEPTGGLDPNSRENAYSIVEEAAKGGAAVLMSSHALDELESRVDRVVIMRQGVAVADGPVSELRARANLPVRVRVRLDPDAVSRAKSRLGGTLQDARTIEIECAAEEKLTRIADILALGEPVEDIEVLPPKLGEVYRVLGDPPPAGNA